MKASPDDPLSVFALAGFLSIFTLIGIGMGFYSLLQWRKGKLPLSEGVWMVLPAAFFTVFPFLMARQEAGWGAVAILGVVNALFITFLVAPTPSAPASGDAKSSAFWLPKPPAAFPSPSLPRKVGSILAAGPCFVLTAAYLAAVLGKLPTAYAGNWLFTLMRTQFLVIHSFPFLMLIVLVRPPLLRWRIVQVYVFLAFFSIYVILSRQDGWDGVLTFVTSTLGVYSGLLLRLSDEKVLTQMGKRWLLSFGLFIVLALLLDLPEENADWFASRNVLHFGLLFFLGLGISEAVGLYDRLWIPARFLKKAKDGTSGE